MKLRLLALAGLCCLVLPACNEEEESKKDSNQDHSQTQSESQWASSTSADFEKGLLNSDSSSNAPVNDGRIRLIDDIMAAFGGEDRMIDTNELTRLLRVAKGLWAFGRSQRTGPMPMPGNPGIHPWQSAGVHKVDPPALFACLDANDDGEITWAEANSDIDDRPLERCASLRGGGSEPMEDDAA